MGDFSIERNLQLYSLILSSFLSIPTIVATPQSIYVGGSFTHIGGEQKAGLAGLDPISGTVNSYTPEIATAGGALLAYIRAIYADQQGLIFTGNFATVDGIPKIGLSGVAFPPNQPASTILAQNPLPDGTGFTLSWTPPSSGAPLGYTVVAIEGASAPTGTPQNGENYLGNSAYTGAPTVPFNGQVVFDGTGTSVAITGLIPNTNYTFVVYPYNGSGGSRVYNASIPAVATHRTNSPLPPTVVLHPGILTVSSATINFGDVALNTSRTRRYTMHCYNLTTASVSITPPAQCEISVGGAPFTASSVIFTTRATIDQVDIRLRFSPSANGVLTGSVTHTAGSTNAVATVSGASSPPSISTSTLSLNFGAVAPSSTATMAYRVNYRNLTTRTITITPPTGFAVSITGNAPFSTTPLTVPTNVSGRFNVYAQFSPATVGVKNGME